MSTEEIQWETVNSPDDTPQSKIVFDTIGDEFTGTFQGERVIPSQDGDYTQYLFENELGRCFVNANYSLREGMRHVRKGNLVRITFTSEVDTGQESLMKQYQVQIGRRPRPTTKPSENS